MIPIIILIVSILLDGLITNYTPYLINNLSLFTPLLTLVSIFIIYPFYRKKEKKYLITVFIVGIIYDLFYTNLLFLNGLLFVLIALITKFIYKNYQVNFFRLIIYTIVIIFIYESVYALLLFIFNLVPITIDKVIYKIRHSLIINIIYIEIVYLILKLIPNKYKKISIN